MLDLKLVNARILTLDEDRPEASRLGVWQGRVFGLDEQVADLPARRVLDARGSAVVPGFIDAHVHLAWAGLKAGTVSVAPSTSVEAILETVRRAARNGQPDEWLDMVGYDQRPLGRHLTAAELDAAAPGRPVILTHDSGHSCVVSSQVLRMLPDGVPHRDGVLVEGGMAAVRELRMPHSEDQLTGALRRSADVCMAEGVTACAEAGVGGGLTAHSPVEPAAYMRLREKGELPLRVQLMVAAAALHPLGSHAEDGPQEGIDLGLRTGFGDDRLGLGALKIFTDGGMMPRTAALTEPYEGLEHSGQLFAAAEELRDTIVRGHLAGWQLAVHAIGDRAVDLTLDAIAEAQRLMPRPAARHRIEHAGLVRPDQLPRFAELGVSAVVQPNFLWYLGDDYAPLMGERRAPWLYRGQGFLDHGVTVAGSSDRPVTEGAPLRAIQVMVERASSTGRAIGPGEAMTVVDALRAYTLGSAYVCNWEHALGSLTPGKWADWAVLSEDPRAVAAGAIGDIDVLGTFVAGESVYGMDPPG
ncbi:amidohydrolase [Streptomyces sp. HNM0575]|uniref:amidohydrolase n=1 Tax=Streptomyces sp. HNM0575 TaxID=2716338 RepID=UPI00145C6706|nr:amidohydrolase [Streptomyces sp. HNM0575]NLU73378.1 amidohydrolase [Streptomyces sp. HNM0575]